MSSDFPKPALSWAEQVELLRTRGLHISDPDRAIFYLARLNYYRLACYWQPLLQVHEPPQFRTDATFEDVLMLYVLDRELRMLILDAIERIEVAARTQWAHQGRMWNHEYTISPMRPIRHPAPLVQDWSRQDRRIHNTLLILLHLMKQVSPESSWPARLLELIKRFGHQWWPHMGFPDGWAQGPSWAPPLNGSPPGEP